MNDSHESATASLNPAKPRVGAPGRPDLPSKFWLGTAVLVLGFCAPLYQVVRFALHSELYSYILLVPFVSGYLAWLERDQLKAAGGPAHAGWSVLFLSVGSGFLLWYGLGVFAATKPDQQDQLALSMYAFVALFWGVCCLSLDRRILGRLVFPLGFLLALAPLPRGAEDALETFLQNGSALVSYVMFLTARTPVFRDGTFFQLPGFALIVAPECSGIHSTVALFITSLVAGQVLLRTRWRRAVLAFVVLPIAFLRNGFRVFVIGELCVHISPDMINSYIHRHGGPIFFALSLIPFFAFMLWLLRSERRQSGRLPSPTPAS